MVFCSVSTLAWLRSSVLLVMLTLMESIHTLSTGNRININNHNLFIWIKAHWQASQCAAYLCCEPHQIRLQISSRALLRPGRLFWGLVGNGSCTLLCLHEESKHEINNTVILQNIWIDIQICLSQSTHRVTCHKVWTPAFSTPEVLKIVQVIYTRRNGHLSTDWIKLLHNGVRETHENDIECVQL